MQLNIAPSTNTVIIDGESVVVDLSAIDPSIQGLHWDGTSGDIARWDPKTRKMLGNEFITDLEEYKWVIDAFVAEKQVLAKKKQDLLESLKLPNAIALRDSLLMQSDWTQLPDVALTAEQKAAWAVYRQQLRDLTDNPAFPDVEFPKAPT